MFVSVVYMEGGGQNPRPFSLAIAFLLKLIVILGVGLHVQAVKGWAPPLTPLTNSIACLDPLSRLRALHGPVCS